MQWVGPGNREPAKYEGAKQTTEQHNSTTTQHKTAKPMQLYQLQSGTGQ